jgi:hypothetical protein
MGINTWQGHSVWSEITISLLSTLYFGLSDDIELDLYVDKCRGEMRYAMGMWDVGSAICDVGCPITDAG